MSLNNQHSVDTIIERVNRYLSRRKVRKRYAGQSLIYDKTDATKLSEILVAYHSLQPEQRRQLFVELVRKHPTNLAIAALCRSLDALTLEEMHQVAYRGLSDRVLAIDNKMRISDIESQSKQVPRQHAEQLQEGLRRYENLRAQASNNDLYSPAIQYLLSNP